MKIESLHTSTINVSSRSRPAFILKDHESGQLVGVFFMGVVFRPCDNRVRGFCCFGRHHFETCIQPFEVRLNFVQMNARDASGNLQPLI